MEAHLVVTRKENVMTTKTKKAHVLRDFTDAGSGKNFKQGDKPELEEGVFANYEAAGLVEAATAKAGGSTPTT